jgi:hypothetical protein
MPGGRQTGGSGSKIREADAPCHPAVVPSIYQASNIAMGIINSRPGVSANVLVVAAVPGVVLLKPIPVGRLSSLFSGFLLMEFCCISKLVTMPHREFFHT